MTDPRVNLEDLSGRLRAAVRKQADRLSEYAQDLGVTCTWEDWHVESYGERGEMYWLQLGIPATCYGGRANPEWTLKSGPWDYEYPHLPDGERGRRLLRLTFVEHDGKKMEPWINPYGESDDSIIRNAVQLARFLVPNIEALTKAVTARDLREAHPEGLPPPKVEEYAALLNEARRELEAADRIILGPEEVPPVPPPPAAPPQEGIIIRSYGGYEVVNPPQRSWNWGFICFAAVDVLVLILIILLVALR